jgi:superfamily II DNA or RNA helicase
MISLTFDYDKKRRQGIISSEIFPEIREYFSVKQPKFGSARFNKHIPDRKYVISLNGRFHTGMYWEIYKYATKNYEGIQVDFTEDFKKAILLTYTGKDVVDRGLRDYQKDIVSKCLKIGTGTVVLATAGGKTFTMASLVESINPVKAIIIVPDPGLVVQTYNDFIKWGLSPDDVSKWTGEFELNPAAKIVIANRSILQSECSDVDWIRFVDLVIVDEVQTLRKDNGITKIVDKIITGHKYGFTGTLPESDIDRWTIMGITGPLIYERKAHELRKDKYVAEAQVLVVKIHYKYFRSIVHNEESPSEKYRREVEELIRYDFRNQAISKLIGGMSKNALLLVDRLEHGEVLLDCIKRNHPTRQVFFINGAVELEDREKIKKLMEKENDIVCIAMSKIFAVGISINNLHYIMFCSGGKSRIRVIQSIGRGLRLHENKTALTIIDIADQTEYGIKHSEKRKLLYAEERIPIVEKEIFET